MANSNQAAPKRIKRAGKDEAVVLKRQRTPLEELESRRQHLGQEEEIARRRERSHFLRNKNRLRSMRR